MLPIARNALRPLIRFLVLFTMLSAIFASSVACGDNIDEELASDLRSSARSYINALERNFDAINELLDALPVNFSAQLELASMTALMDQLIETSRRQLAGYSDETILGEPFLNRMDEVVGEVNLGLTEIGPVMDFIHVQFGTDKIRNLVRDVERTATAVSRAGVNWQVTRSRVSD